MFLPTSKINWLTIVVERKGGETLKRTILAFPVCAKVKKKKSVQFEYCLSFHQGKNLYQLLKEEKSRFIGDRIKNGDILITFCLDFTNNFGVK